MTPTELLSPLLTYCRDLPGFSPDAVEVAETLNNIGVLLNDLEYWKQCTADANAQLNAMRKERDELRARLESAPSAAVAVPDDEESEALAPVDGWIIRSPDGKHIVSVSLKQMETSTWLELGYLARPFAFLAASRPSAPADDVDTRTRVDAELAAGK